MIGKRDPMKVRSCSLPLSTPAAFQHLSSAPTLMVHAQLKEEIYQPAHIVLYCIYEISVPILEIEVILVRKGVEIDGYGTLLQREECPQLFDFNAIFVFRICRSPTSTTLTQYAYFFQV